MNWVVSESASQEVQAPAPPETAATRPVEVSPGSGSKVSLIDSGNKAALIEQLKQENARLHAMLAQLRPSDSPGRRKSVAEAGAQGDVHPSEFVPGEHSVIFVCTSNKPEDSKNNGAFVAVMDVNDDEWWEVIDPEKDCALQQPELIDSDYVMVEDKEVLSALSKFVAGTLKGYPEAKDIPPAQLKKLLDRSFSTLQEKGMIMKMYDWASFAYTSYGWASYGWALYQDPTMLKMVAKWSFSAATWIMFVL